MRIPWLPLIGAVALGVAPPDVLRGDPAKLLMPFLGLLMAGIFPAISLAINSLKSGGFSVQRVQDLAGELGKLLNYLQALFVVALLAALCLVAAEAMHWGHYFPQSFYAARVFNIILGACLGILIAALPRIRTTFSVLLTITREIAVDEASTNIRDRAAKVPSIIDRFPTKEKFGELYEVGEAKKAE